MPAQFSIRRQRNGGGLYSTLLENAFDRALALDAKIAPETLAIRGMSGVGYRMFINNLIASMPDARYLEIGSWMGSTACAAMQGNRLSLTCIDDWSKFGGPRDQFFGNIEAHKTEIVDFRFIESDFRAVDYAMLGTFNVYLFDGPHKRQDQYDGVTMALPALDHQFVFVVDDWNWGDVRDGTLSALAACGLKIRSAIEIRTSQDGSHPAVQGEDSDWHNGYFLSVLEKAGS